MNLRVSAKAERILRALYAAGLLALIGGMQGSMAAETSPSTNFLCDGTGCACIGASDCRDMARSGFCGRPMRCGRDAKLPPDHCVCEWVKAPSPSPGPSQEQPPASNRSR
jgi:hypothetical protein